MKKYELLVIGTGPAGEKAAVKAAYFGHKVAIVEKSPQYGGAMCVTGTLPSKTLKETALFLSGKYEKGLYGIDRDLSRAASIEDFMYRKKIVSQTEGEAIETNLHRHGVEIFHGVASFVDPHTIAINGDVHLYGDYIIVATGSYPYHPAGIPFDSKRIHDSDTILEINRFPKSLCIVGAGVIGCEYATIFSTTGTKVHLVNNQDKILPFLDQEIRDELIQRMHQGGISTLFNRSIQRITVPEHENEMIRVELDNEEYFETDMFLFAAGRGGQIADLKCERAGLEMGKKGRLIVDSTYKTNVDHIYAVGDVIGFPALASTSADQGRVAVAHIFKTKDLNHLPSCFPYGIYTIPEVSSVGISEDEAKKKGIPYCIGRSRYADMPRGLIMGTKGGMLKIVFDRDSLKTIGVHVIGNAATEIIHFGLLLVEDEKSLYDVIATVFNYPTLHDLYKYAAYDGLSTITGHRVKP